ncbi:MAG: tRNA (adenosine(37)-N6)-threonylcarbamoyltransferase complex ATPase subunit type 1 TsaE [Planctomycetota bacterium]
MTSTSSQREHICGSVDETIALARELAQSARAGDIIALEGPLGSGKTTFVRAFAESRGVDGTEISSPTYVICHEYPVAGGPTIVHIDAYRMHADDDLVSLGGEEVWSRNDVILLIEWPDRLGDSMPTPTMRIEFEHVDASTRRLVMSSGGADSASDGGAVTTRLTCPECGTSVSRDAETAPFCSSRCKMVDLNKWFGGKHMISRPLQADDLDGQF